MSLQVWLPLEGNLENLGLKKVTPTSSNVTINDDGKTGKCYAFNGSNSTINTGYGNGLNTAGKTIAVWVRANAVTNNMMILRSPGTSPGRLYIGIKNSTWNLSYGSTAWGYTSSATLKANEWQHVCVVITSTEASLYVDGVFVRSISNSSFSLPGNIVLSPESYRWNGCMNDLRIYDHALSLKEIRELSKALILHYKLDDDISGYQRLEYIQSSGTQYIDTLVNPQVKPRVVARFAFLNNSARDYWGNKNTTGSAFVADFKSRNLQYYRYGTTTSRNVNCTISSFDSVHEWDVSKEVYVDGVLRYTSPDTYTYSSSQSTIQIFKAARANYYSTYRLYSFVLYDGDTVVRDFVPARRIVDGEVGLFDLVSNTFFENKGTGSFIAGNPINWNQLANFANIAAGTSKNVSYRLSLGNLYLSTTEDGVDGTGNVTIYNNMLNESKLLLKQVTGHKYYSPNTLPAGFSFMNNNFSHGIRPCVEAIQEGYSTTTNQYWVLKGTGGTVVAEEARCALVVYDLTEMYGKGNEPTLAKAQELFRNRYYAATASQETMFSANPVIYDCSGYRRNGTVIGKLDISSDSSRHTCCAEFHSSAIAVGNVAKVKETISVCLWASMDYWGSISSRSSVLISCTQAGGWNFEKVSGETKMEFVVGTGTTSNVYQHAVCPKAYTEWNAGWHFFVGTYDGLKARMYMDGELVATCSDEEAYSEKTPMFYHSSNGIFIAAEAYTNATSPNSTPYYFMGKMSDVRIYATALSAEDIREMYATAAWIDNDGNLLCYDIDEEAAASPEIEKTGLAKAPKFIEFSDDLVFYDYIQCSGTQYIDTGVLLSNDDKFEICFQRLANTTTMIPMFGAISGGTSYTDTDNLSITYLSLAKFGVYCDGDAGNGNYAWGGGSITDLRVHTIKYNGLNVAPTIDGVAMTQQTAHTLSQNTPTVTTWIFGRNNTGNGNVTNENVRLFSCKMFNGDTLVRDFVPCTLKGEAGLWDKANSKFYGNDGTGEFIVGTPIEIQKVASVYEDKIVSTQIIEF